MKIASDADWIAVEFATALASVAAGAEPRMHIFAVTAGGGVFSEHVLRIALSENSVWSWIDPAAPPSIENVRALCGGVGARLTVAVAVAVAPPMPWPMGR